jgi:hypothetical protein
MRQIISENTQVRDIISYLGFLYKISAGHLVERDTRFSRLQAKRSGRRTDY